ncbi:putative monovalent cation/H+ antiporter subunit C [Rubripirellula lacrimiformis]|uniref:Putative monovalent cation/H+ antiporter subunit C n=1 Tax=Rubripirellula lacrimiformis TaxID=1930273 RepID=A0A517NFH7_9BACT|nr:cation:proton antiporter subunit C [Rubripirellula lacrimiformis]QDT05873.1 putative monovalent cation/H+ antiporter subunit C [Rubripirellula lacrimiformis]
MNIGISAEQFFGLFNYWVVVFLMMTGFYIVIARGNLIKTIIGLNIFQNSVFLLYITMGKIDGATAPIVPPAIAAQNAEHGGHAVHGASGSGHSEQVADAVDLVHGADLVQGADVGHGADQVAEIIYSNPLPSVLMLTAIVVGIATTATALALIVRIREEYGTIEEDEILELDRAS